MTLNLKMQFQNWKKLSIVKAAENLFKRFNFWLKNFNKFNMKIKTTKNSKIKIKFKNQTVLKMNRNNRKKEMRKINPNR